jgi:hypothetical protein
MSTRYVIPGILTDAELTEIGYRPKSKSKGAGKRRRAVCGEEKDQEGSCGSPGSGLLMHVLTDRWPDCGAR